MAPSTRSVFEAEPPPSPSQVAAAFTEAVVNLEDALARYRRADIEASEAHEELVRSIEVYQERKRDVDEATNAALAPTPFAL